MADHVETRFLLECETITPVAHGSGVPSSLTDNPFRRTADGHLIVGGTSIAGVLRTLVERQVDQRCLLYDDAAWKRAVAARKPCDCAVCRLFGDVVPVDTPGGSAGPAAASRVWVHDARLEPAEGSRIVDSVAIDGRRRAAEDAKKFDREEVPAGTRLLLDVCGESLTDDERRWLETALAWLAGGQVGLGGGAASGSGLLKCIRAAIYRRNLGDRHHLLAALSHDDEAAPAEVGRPLSAWPEIVRDAFEKFSGRKTPFAQIRWRLLLEPDPQFGGTFLVADPLAGAVSGWDRAPRGLTPAAFAAELPSRSVRGALRSGAERILKTICPDPKRAEQLRDALFGFPPQGRPHPDSSQGAQGMRDTPSGSTAAASRLRVAVEPDRPAQPSPWDHVAIDRFTGGASEGKKFDALAARGGRFQLTLTLLDASDGDLPWMQGLLALTLRDLHEGRITLGHGSAKGHGFFRLLVPPPEGAADDQPRRWTGALQAEDDGSVQSWIDALHQEMAKPVAAGQAAEDASEADNSAASASAPKTLLGPQRPAVSAPRRAKQPPKEAEAEQGAAEPAKQPEPWTARAVQASTADLPAIAELCARHCGEVPLLAFLESPTRCAIRDWSAGGLDWNAELAGAWHFRLFGEPLELAARRIGHEGEADWAVRLSVADQAPLSEELGARFASAELLPLGTPDRERTVNLLGSARGGGEEVSQTRFSAANPSLSYPGDWPQGAALRVRVFPAQGEPVVCWVGANACPGATGT